MIYILAALLPPIGLLMNGQPFSALFNLLLLVVCVILGIIFQPLWLLPSVHAVIAVAMKREQRRHREIVEAIERHGPPPAWRP
jgi:predicted LPLAT superfamily acyltransferase